MHRALLGCCKFVLALVVVSETGDRSGLVEGQEPVWDLPRGVEYSAESRTDPRPLRIYRLSIDLKESGYEFAVSAGPDPDGDGPIEALLTPPKKLGEAVSAVALINTSAWAMLPDPETGKKPGYVAGGPADILGWVADRDRKISTSQSGYWTCTMDKTGRATIQDPDGGFPPPQGDSVAWAVSGFRGILIDGRILPEPSDVRHPRTALGMNADGDRMIWMVVDGRQPGTSEGVSEQELAQLMLESGCDDAMNLDGGGSSVMLLRTRAGSLRAANRPSDPTGQRPVPVVLCIRRSEQSN